MTKKIILFITITHIICLNLFSQNPVEEYEPPKVIEGSNLLVISNPNAVISREGYEQTIFFRKFDFNLGIRYNKWRFTKKLDYALSSKLTMYYEHLAISGDEGINIKQTLLSFNLHGGITYYLTNKMFIGTYVNNRNGISNNQKPRFILDAYPYAGFGRIEDAFVVNEVTNFENVLLKESYIDKKLDKKTRAIINNLLDKRNGKEFYSKYKDDFDIAFFEELEEILLNKKIINKPLNARVTLKLLQTLYNNNFILFPLYKGYLLQIETENTIANTDENNKNPKSLTLSGVYGLPYGNFTSLLFSGHLMFPFDKNNDDVYYIPTIHSPLFIRSLYQNTSNLNLIIPEYSYNYDHKYDYKLSARMHLFHYINSTAGFTCGLEYNLGKIQNQENSFNHNFHINTALIFNILNKFNLTTSIDFTHLRKSRYFFSAYSSFSYFIF